MRTFVDNLLSATELTAKAALLQLPLQSLLESKTDDHFAGLYDYSAKLGNASPEYAALMNRLRELRKKARYLESPYAREKCYVASPAQQVRCRQAQWAACSALRSRTSSLS